MELLETADGSLTLRHEVLGELYHSDRGAVGEAEHVYIRAGLDRALKERTAVSVFEVGFGTGLNGWLTCLRAQETGVKIDYRTVRQLNYTSDPVFTTLHDLPWDGLPHTVSEYFTLTKYEADLLSFDFVSLKGCFDVVYFDAFAPDVQPELWSEEVMRWMYAILGPGGALTTYSAKGTVKRALRTAGFEVFRLPGALGKRHMLRAVKSL